MTGLSFLGARTSPIRSHNLAILIDDAEIYGSGRDIQPDKVALGHTESLFNRGSALLMTNLQTVL